MGSVWRWLQAFILVAIGAAALSYVILLLAGGLEVIDCGPTNVDCLQQQSSATDRSLLIATTIGIALSAIGTMALVITIVLSHKATEAAVEAADAAKLAVSLARDSAAREFRPYVSFEKHSLAWNHNNGVVTSWSVRIHWQNTGVTSASDVRSRTNFAVIPGKLPPDFDFPDSGSDPWAGNIGRDKSIYSDTPSISLDKITAVLEKRERLYVWSWIEYSSPDTDEIFRTEFHAEFALWDGPADNKAMAHRSMFQGRFNGSDKKSFRKPGSHFVEANKRV